jgi:hypothetical protein
MRVKVVAAQHGGRDGGRNRSVQMTQTTITFWDDAWRNIQTPSFLLPMCYPEHFLVVCLFS